MPSNESANAFNAILNPRSIALVGASAAPEKAGGRRWKTLVEGGFDGALYPIHPKAREILGRRAYRSVRDLPGPIDLAVVIVSPGDVPGVVADSLAQGARGVVVVSAGFGETSESGRLVEQELATAARASGARLLGPNCAGIYSGPARVNVVGWEMRPGRIALVSQSGNLALDFADLSRKTGQGFSRAVTIGNAADVRAVDLIEYCLNDPQTDVVLAYLEGFGPLEGRRLCELVDAASTPKPIVILKPGRSEGGRRAAMSHTGSLAGEDRLIDAALRQHGILRAFDVEEAWQAAVALTKRVPMRSNSVAVLTDGGGHATLFCDAAGLAGLATPPFSEPTRRALQALLPERCATSNPVDFAGLAERDPGVVPKALEICLADAGIGGAVMVGHFGGYEKLGGPTLRPQEIDAASAIADIADRHQKPVQVHSVHADANPPALVALRDRRIPVLRSVDMSARTLGHLVQAGRLGRPTPDAPSAAASPPYGIRPRSAYAGSSWLQEPEARTVLESWGVRVPRWAVVGTPEECARAAESFGGAVVLKLVSAGALHKSDIGGVLLGVKGPDRAAAGCSELLAKAEKASLGDARVLVAAMVQGRVELVVGAFRDPQFGPAIMVGAGGVLVELLDDVSFRLAPVSGAMAIEMVQELRVGKLLRGYRGAAPIDVSPVAALIARVSAMMSECPEISEIDLNPVILADDGAHVADARIVLDHSI
ncbi:MAG: acetate--CoA ligase family protein [Rhodospirillales bacterium]|nr:acetate--CoA ligase family protein [Rhodospirillales bacterium]